MSIHFSGGRLHGWLWLNVESLGKHRLNHKINCASGNGAPWPLQVHSHTSIIIYLRFFARCYSQAEQFGSAGHYCACVLVCVTYAIIIGKQNKNKTDLITIIYL